MKIGIAGAGGLGSNVAVHLVRSGISSLKICDFDVIENSNLNRQFYFKDQIGQNKVNALFENLKRINPSLNLQIIQRKFLKTGIYNALHGQYHLLFPVTQQHQFRNRRRYHQISVKIVRIT